MCELAAKMKLSRALPRCFLPGANPEAPIPLPSAEYEKFHRVLRLSAGDEVAILPDDGTLIRARYEGKTVQPLCVERPETELTVQMCIAQALPKGDKLDEIIRSCTALGAQSFILFGSDRSVVRWDEGKIEARIKRLETIAKEACEVSFRTRLPKIKLAPNLGAVLEQENVVVLSESESASKPLTAFRGDDVTLCIGPEGGWAPKERELFGSREVTLGPRVLRVEHAAAAGLAALVIP